MTLLLSDPAVAAVPVEEAGDPLVVLSPALTSPEAEGPVRVRAGLGQRLHHAQTLLPDGVRLAVVEGHRSPASQQRIIEEYRAEVLAHHPDAVGEELHALVSRFVAPLAVAPHVAGAAVDLTLHGPDGPLDLGTLIDATPERSGGRCYLDAVGLSAQVRHHRHLLRTALGGAGLVNYPTEWWHWSHGDAYWALITGAPAATCEIGRAHV